MCYDDYRMDRQPTADIALQPAEARPTPAETKRLRAELAAAQARIQELEAALGATYAERNRLRAQLADAQETIAQLMAENQRLEQEVKDLKQAPFKSRKRKRSASSQRSKKRKRGRAAGHPGSGRKRPPEIDRTERIPAGDACPDCGTSFTGEGVERDRVVEDIEPIRPTIVTRYVIERRWCPHCETYKESPVTAALPRHRLGLHLMLFVVYQKVALGLSYRKIQHELQIYFGLHVSPGQLANIVEEVAQLFGPAYARLIRLLREQAALHVDETSWRVNGKNHWLWVFVNDVVALYVISHSRGSKVPKALLGADFDGVVISDFYSAYSPLDMEKAKCWAHLLRDSHDLTKGKPPPDSERVRFHRKLHDLFIEMGLALEEAAADEEQREQIYQEMRSKLHDFAVAPWEDADCQRLADRIIKYLDDLVLWLRDPAVSPDNNMAERSLRPAVVTRKTSFGSRSRQGALAFARLLSLIQTWERQDKDFFTTAYSALETISSQN